MIYKVFASLKSDMNEGWVWITAPKVPSRSIIEIENTINRKKVYCEALQIDQNYLKDYKKGNTNTLPNNEPTITLNSWYRTKLGLEETNKDYNLLVKPSNHLYGRFRASIGHPQMVVRLATWLAIISTILGIVSFFPLQNN